MFIWVLWCPITHLSGPINFIFCKYSLPEPAYVVYDYEQGDLLLFRWPTRKPASAKTNEVEKKGVFCCCCCCFLNEGERTRKVEIRTRKKFLAWARHAWLYSDLLKVLKENIKFCQLWVLNRGDLNFCVHSTSLLATLTNSCICWGTARVPVCCSVFWGSSSSSIVIFTFRLSVQDWVRYTFTQLWEEHSNVYWLLTKSDWPEVTLCGW